MNNMVELKLPAPYYQGRVIFLGAILIVVGILVFLKNLPTTFKHAPFFIIQIIKCREKLRDIYPTQMGKIELNRRLTSIDVSINLNHNELNHNKFRESCRKTGVKISQKGGNYEGGVKNHLFQSVKNSVLLSVCKKSLVPDKKTSFLKISFCKKWHKVKLRHWVKTTPNY
jgi:hypothetical protein